MHWKPQAILAAMMLGAICRPAAASEPPAPGAPLNLGTLALEAGREPKGYQQALGSFDTIETLVSMVADGTNQEWAPVCGILLSNRTLGGRHRIVRIFLKWDEIVPGMLAQLMHGQTVIDEDDLADSFERNQVLRVKLTWRNGKVDISLNGYAAGNVHYDFPIDTIALYSENAKCVFTSAKLSSFQP